MDGAFTRISEFFYGLSNEEAIILGIVGLLVFTLGILIGWIVQSSTTRRYKKQLMLAVQERDDYQRQYTTAEEQRKQLARELEEMSQQKVDALDQLEIARREISTRNAEINTLRTQLSERPEGGVSSIVDTGEGGDDLNPYLAAIEAKFDAFERRLDELAQENAHLRKTNLPADRPYYQPTIGESAAPNEAAGPLVIRADGTEPGARTGDDGRTDVIVDTKPSLMVPVLELHAEDQDDLTEIATIGPFNQRKLNEHGVFTYAQIAAWTDNDVRDYAAKIGYVADIMIEEDWVGQAKKLVTMKEQEPERYQRHPITDRLDDLKVVEGIGPKTESVLQEAGITNCAVLAATPADELNAILEQAGGRFKGRDPGTWPQQAALAVDGKWEELKKWQAELKGGRQ